jgi:PAS domain S-box-containing protein
MDFAMSIEPTYEELKRRVLELEKANFEREKVLKALYESEELFRTLSDLASVGIYLTTPEGGCQYANPSWCEMAGLSLEDALGEGWVKGLHPDDRESVFSNWLQMVASEGHWGHEYRFKTPAGKVTWVYGLAKPQRDAQGKIVGYVGINTDITERKKTEELLRESEQRHRTILSTAMDGFWMVDIHGSLLQVNNTYCQMSGYSEQELLSMCIPALEARENTDDTAAHLQKTIMKGHDRFESCHRRKDGSLFEVEISVQYRPDEGGRFLVFLRDITKRKLSDEKLRESEEKFRSLAENSTDYIMRYDRECRHLYINSAGLRVAGLEAEDLIGKTHHESGFPENLCHLWEERIIQVFKTSEPYKVEFEFTGVDGPVVLELLLSPEFDAEGNVCSVLGVSRDITERKKIEETLRKEHYFLCKAQEIGEIGSWELDVQKNELVWTDENYRIFGIPVGTKLTYEIFLNCVHPDDKEYVDTQWKSAFDKKAYDIEHRILIDGRVKWIREKAELEFNEKDECIRAIGFSQDITARKDLEDRIKHQLSVLTQPEVKFDDLSLTDILEADTLQRIQDAFSEAFEMPSIIYGPDGKPLTKPSNFTSFCKLVRGTEKGASKCELFDKNLMEYLLENPSPYIRTGCFIANMVTGTVPIVIQGKHLANWGIGQMIDSAMNMDEIQAHALAIGVERADLINAAMELKKVDEEFFKRAVNFLKMLSDQISLLGLYNLQQGREINNRIKIEETLREKEQLYRSMFEQNQAIKLLIDPESGKIIDANSAACKFYQYSHAEITKLFIWDINTLGEVETRKCMIQVMLDNEPEFEFMHRLGSGETRYVLVYSSELKIQGKSILYSVVVDITDRKNAQTKLKQYADNLRIVFDSAPNILALVDENIRVEMINRNGALLVGKGIDALSGLLCGDVFNCKHAFHGDGCGTNPECPDCPLRSRVLSTFETGKPQIEEEGQMTFILNGKEVVVDILISTSLLSISDNRKVLLSLMDISESKNAIRALRESEEKFRFAFHTSPDSINLNRLEDGMYLEINQGFTQITGYTREETVGKTSLELNVWKNPDDRKRLVEGLKQKGYVENMEAEFVAKDGRIRDGLISATTMKFKNENVIISIIRDISERKQAENLLKESESIHKELFDNSPIPLYIQDFSETAKCVKELKEKSGIKDIKSYLQGNPDEVMHLANTVKIVRGNKAAAIVYKANSADNLPKQLASNMKKDDLQHFIDQVADFTEGKDWFEGEARNLDFKGNILDIILRKAVINREQNGLSKIIVSVTDVTDLHNSHREKAKLESRLQQAQKMEAIGSLAGGIAHDLNNILFPISGFSEMLLDEIPPDNHTHESIEQIYKSAKRGSDLVNQILAFSRQSNIQKLPIRIQPILKEVLKLVRATIPKNIELTSHIEKDCGRVSADPTQIHQIAMNLITNAYHAVEENGGSINIELKETEFGRDDLHDYVIKPGKYVILSVSDTGTGIDQSLIDKIFDPYFTTKEQGKGTGLGLSVVLGIVKEHGGDVRVDSQAGKGTTFKVYLPLDINTNDNKAAAIVRAYPTGTENILLVDDEEPITQMVQKMLERLGYNVTSRISSPDALGAFRANPLKFDLVISDRGMPNMTGEQLARELISIKPDIPIIICTGFSNVNDELHAKSMGVKGFLNKPVATGDLAEMVRKVLDDTYGTS